MFNTNVHPAAANQRNVCLLLDARDCSGGFVTGIGMALARQRDSGRRRFLADFDCQCGQAWSLADRRPFRGQLQTNAHTSIVKAIYSPKVMLFSAKLPGHSTANRASTSLDGAAPRYFQKATLKKIGDFIGVL
jgi:hypothetical protein